jgi:hypothetical protein
VSETKKEITLMQAAPWIAVVVLAYLFWSKQDATPGPTPDPKPVVVTIEKATSGVLPSLKQYNAKVFNEAATRIRSRDIKSDKELFEFVQPATKKARELANKPFDMSLEMTLPRNQDGSFIGIEEEAAAVCERIAKSW